MPYDRAFIDTQRTIASGVDLDRRSENGVTFLHYWVSAERPDIVELLLDAGADVGIADNSGWTPLHFAVATGNVEVVRMLAAHGADPHAATASRRTGRSLWQRLCRRYPLVSPLELASEGGREAILSCLRERAQEG